MSMSKQNARAKAGGGQIRLPLWASCKGHIEIMHKARMLAGKV